MEDANKIEEQTKEENNTVEEVKDEELIEVVGDADEVINESEKEVK